MITTSVYAFSKCCSLAIAFNVLFTELTFLVSDPSRLIIAFVMFRFNVVFINSSPRFNSPSSSFYYASISTLSLSLYISSIPTHPPYCYHIIITLRLLRRRDAACGGGVVVDREARRLRSYRPLDEGIHEEAEGKRKLWSE